MVDYIPTKYEQNLRILSPGIRFDMTKYLIVLLSFQQCILQIRLELVEQTVSFSPPLDRSASVSSVEDAVATWLASFLQRSSFVFRLTVSLTLLTAVLCLSFFFMQHCLFLTYVIDARNKFRWKNHDHLTSPYVYCMTYVSVFLLAAYPHGNLAFNLCLNSTASCRQSTVNLNPN